MLMGFIRQCHNNPSNSVFAAFGTAAEFVCLLVLEVDFLVP